MMITVRAPGKLAVGARAAAVVGLLAIAGCFGNTTTDFPPGLEPLEDDTAPMQQGGAYTETLVMVTQPLTTYNSVHGRGYILASPGTVWAASKNPDVMDQGCEVSSRMATVGVEPDYEYSLKMHYTVNDIITVEWDELWRFGTLEGTPEVPDRAIIRYQKVAGTEFIKILEGSVQLWSLPDDPDVTMVEYIEHVNARSSNASDTMKSMQERFDQMVAASHGLPVPPCP
jgi:hypothetical protein